MDARKLIFFPDVYTYAENVIALRQSRALSFVPVATYKTNWVPVEYYTYGFGTDDGSQPLQLHDKKGAYV